MTRGHIPVMLDDVLRALGPRDGGIYVDGTFGGGGYTRAILEAAATTVFGIDRDPGAVTLGAEMSRRYVGRLTVLAGRFGDMRDLMKGAGVSRVDGVVLDLGLSSTQLDDGRRGFSFRADGPLDMRMGDAGPTAAELVNAMPERDLADLIHSLGEERRARRVARAIVEARAESPIQTTGRLAEIVRAVVRPAKDGIDPATRTFLALRIHVNDELGEIDRGLEAAEWLLAPGGRLAVVSFHSLEDRKVKDFLRVRSGAAPRPSRHLPDTPEARPDASFSLTGQGLTGRRPARASKVEIAANHRARSALLRAAERTAAPAWPGGLG